MKSRGQRPRGAAAIVALCCVLGPWHGGAEAGDALDVYPAASLRLDFGHKTVQGALGLALRSSIPAAETAPSLVAFEVTPRALSAQLAGVPVALRRFQVNQQDSGNGAEPGASHQWMWWTGAGLAATAGLLSALSSGSHNDGNRSGSTTVSGCVFGVSGTNGSPGCVVSCPGGPPTACSPLTASVPEAIRALEAGVERDPAEDEPPAMGDLLPAKARPAALE